jgi:hypothetical protein
MVRRLGACWAPAKGQHIRLHRAGNDAGNDCGESVYCAVDFEGLVMIAKEEVSTGDRSGVRTREVGSIDMAV